MFKNCLSHLFLILILVVFTLQADTDVWNRIVYMKSHFQTADYTFQNNNNQQSDVFRGPFSLELYSNLTFKMAIDYGSDSPHQLIVGQLAYQDQLSLFGHSYVLTSKELTGTAVYEVEDGLKWTFSLQIKNKGIKLIREEVKYKYVNWISVIIFGIVGVILLPLNHRITNKILYNVRKRTNSFMLYLLLLKLSFVLVQFLINSYRTIINNSWYYIFIVYSVYLLTLTPSIIHFLYFLSSLQKQIKTHEWFNSLGVTMKCLLMSAIILSIPFMIIWSIFFFKGIYFYFASSLITIYQYFFSCNHKKYGYSKLLMYDLLATAVLTTMSAFLPSLNFTILSFKQIILFWNYYLGIFIIGIVLTRNIIKLQISEETHLEENTETDPSNNERSIELPSGQTRQTLEQ